MNDRFYNLFALEENLYIDGSPVVISAGVLLKDNYSGAIVSQFKIQNVGANTIIAARISLRAFDISKRELPGVDDYQYLDLSVQQGEHWGADKAIIMPNPATRSIEIKGIEVVFDNRTVWKEECSERLKPIPKGELIQNKLTDGELLKQYRLETSSSAQFVPTEYCGLWLCSCGTPNSGTKCSGCQAEKERVFSALNIEYLSTNAKVRLEDDRVQAAKNEKAKKQRVRRTFAGLVTLSLIIAVLVFCQNWLLPNVIDPHMRYKNACALASTGEFDGAITEFISLGDYKDARDQINAVKYAKAEALLSNNLCIAAIKEFEDLGDYRDSKSKITQAENIYEALEKKKEEEEKIQAYQEAENLLASGNMYDAAVSFYKSGDYSDARQRSELLWDELLPSHGETVSVYYDMYVSAIAADGSVLVKANPNNDDPFIPNADSISDAKAICVDRYGIYVLNNQDGENLKAFGAFGTKYPWENIVSFSCDRHSVYGYIAGIGMNGQVYIGTEFSQDIPYEVFGWDHIVDVSFEYPNYIIGLRSDGTVVYHQLYGNEQIPNDIKIWKNIKAIAADDNCILGLKKDGTVLLAVNNDEGKASSPFFGHLQYDPGQYDTSDWTNIKSVSSSSFGVLGIKEDGTVVAIGYISEKCRNLSSWRNISQIAVSGNTVVGLTNDGDILIDGEGADDFDFADWNNLMVPNSK